MGLSPRLDALLGVDDAFDSSPRCGVTRLLPVDPGAALESLPGFASAVGKVTLLWGVLWYAGILFARLVVLKSIPSSSVATENNPIFVGQKFTAMLKVILVSGMANACLWGFQGKPLEQHFLGGPAIEIAGILFTTFELADLGLGMLHGLMDLEYVVHHVLHILLGLIIRGNCMTGLLAAVLMAQVRRAAACAVPAPSTLSAPRLSRRTVLCSHRAPVVAKQRWAAARRVGVALLPSAPLSARLLDPLPAVLRALLRPVIASSLSVVAPCHTTPSPRDIGQLPVLLCARILS